jgi:hypothetical protein
MPIRRCGCFYGDMETSDQFRRVHLEMLDSYAMDQDKLAYIVVHFNLWK